ncbi:MAG: response regulator, partial [Planctomycetota bacterium]
MTTTTRKRPLRVLVVEDEPILLRTVSDRLSDEGYRVRAEGEGVTGLNAFREEPFDIILLDLVMPGIDGLKILEEIRAVNADTPIIVMTAHGTVETAVKAMKLGSSEFVTKPFRLEELSQRIKTYADIIRLKEENLVLKAEVGERPIVGKSQA